MQEEIKMESKLNNKHFNIINFNLVKASAIKEIEKKTTLEIK